MIFYTNSEDPQLLDKEEEYIHYIDDHKSRVIEAFTRLFPFDDENFTIPGYDKIDTLSIKPILAREITHHDESKYSEEEFAPYRRHFHPTDIEKVDGETVEDINAFEIAWHHHYTHNPHHPQFWCWIKVLEYSDTNLKRPKRFEYTDTKQDPVDMDIVSICHMLCDWEAMSNKFGGTTKGYWTNAKEKKFMSKNTIDTVDKLINALFKE